MAWAPYFAFRHLRKVSLQAQDTLTTYLTSVINQNQISIQRASGLLEYGPDILQPLNIRQFIPLKVLPSLWEEQGILLASYNLNRAGLIFCYRYLLLGEEAKYLPAWIYRARGGRTGNWASLFSSEDCTSHSNSDTGFYGTKILVCPSQVKFVAGMKQASPKSVGWLTTRTAAVLHRVRRIWALWHLRCADSRGTRSDRPHNLGFGLSLTSRQHLLLCLALARSSGHVLLFCCLHRVISRKQAGQRVVCQCTSILRLTSLPASKNGLFG